MDKVLATNIYKPIGERIWDERIRKNYSRELLAEKADISDRFLYDIENGKKGFTVFVLCKLCDALGVSTGWVVSGEGRK